MNTAVTGLVIGLVVGGLAGVRIGGAMMLGRLGRGYIRGLRGQARGR